MHKFCELVQHTTTFTLNALEAAFQLTTEEIQVSATTQAVKALQVMQLQKAILSVGMFAMFDAELQEKLQCKNGFIEANKRLKIAGHTDLCNLFENLQLAVNVLKHGRGRSYDALIVKGASLPFRVKLPNEVFFNEGDASETSTLIEVNDKFVLMCANVIKRVSDALNISS